MNAWMKPLAPIALLLAGCNGIVLDPLGKTGQNAAQGEGGEGGTEDLTAGAGGGGQGGSAQGGHSQGGSGEGGHSLAPHAIAVPMANWDIPSDSTVSTTMPPPFPEVSLAPDNLALFFSNRAQGCAVPLIEFEAPPEPADCPAAAYWQLLLVLPHDMVHPGVINLQDDRIWVYYIQQQPPTCLGFAVSEPGHQGTLQIFDIAPDAISLKLDFYPMNEPNDWPLAIESGEYTAPFCW